MCYAFRKGELICQSYTAASVKPLLKHGLVSGLVAGVKHTGKAEENGERKISSCSRDNANRVKREEQTRVCVRERERERERSLSLRMRENDNVRTGESK